MMSTRWHVILVVTLALGVGLLASISAASRPAVAQSRGASITTNKSTYQIGDSITICYTVPGPGPITITDSLSGVLKSGVDDGTGGCFSGTITPPAGQECERLSYQSSRGSGSTQTCFQVASGQNTNNASNQTPRYPGGSGSSSAPAFVSITTNKSQYQVGETAQVCYRVSGPGQVVVTDTHGSTIKTIVSGHDDGTGDCINGVVTPPSGTVTENISFTADSGGVASAQTSFTVNGASSSGGNGSGSNGGNSSPNTGMVTLNLQPGCNQVTSTFPNGTIGANIAATIQPSNAVYGIRVQGSGGGKSIFFSDPNAPTDALTANYQDSLIIQVSQAATLTEPQAQFNVSVSAVPCVVVFYGSIQTSSGSTVGGASITAAVGTTACGNGSSDNLGNYAVTVTCAGNAGSAVTFQVNGVVASNTGTIPTNPGGAAVHLNLTVPSSNSAGSPGNAGNSGGQTGSSSNSSSNNPSSNSGSSGCTLTQLEIHPYTDGSGSGIQIQVKETGQTTTTDDNGDWSVSLPGAGSYTIVSSVPSTVVAWIDPPQLHHYTVDASCNVLSEVTDPPSPSADQSHWLIGCNVGDSLCITNYLSSVGACSTDPNAPHCPQTGGVSIQLIAAIGQASADCGIVEVPDVLTLLGTLAGVAAGTLAPPATPFIVAELAVVDAELQVLKVQAALSCLNDMNTIETLWPNN